jgi:hypothetical protein
VQPEYPETLAELPVEPLVGGVRDPEQGDA